MDFNVFFDLLQFPHHLFIDVQTSCCIQKHHIIAVLARMFHARLGDIQRLVIRPHGKSVHALLFRVDFQLFYSGRTVNVTGNEQGLFPLQFELARQLRCRCSLTCTLKATHHDNRRRLSRLHGDLRHFRTHERGHLFVYDLNHHLPRIQAAHHIRSDGPFLHRFHELLHHAKIYVRFQKRHLDFLHGSLHIRFRQPSLAAQILKYILKFIRQAFKCHMVFLYPKLTTIPADLNGCLHSVLQTAYNSVSISSASQFTSSESEISLIRSSFCLIFSKRAIR